MPACITASTTILSHCHEHAHGLAAGGMAYALAFAVFLAGVCCSTPQAKAAEANETTQAYESMVLGLPGVTRYYTFEETTAEKPEAASRVGKGETLRYGGPDALEVVEGRTPGRTAVRLDRGWMEGPAVPVDRAVSVAVWFRKHGQGGELGNGQTNGMILAQGDGYWSGLRLYGNYPQHDLLFQLGRPQPANAITAQSTEPATDGTWHLVVATWDGSRMRVYLNGLLLGTQQYDGVYTVPSGGRLRIGFAGAGVGSLRLDVDEAVFFNRALEPTEVLQFAVGDAEVPEAVVEQYAAATDAMDQGDWLAAEGAFVRLTETVASADTTTERACYGVAALGRAAALWRTERRRDAVAAYAVILDHPEVSESARAIAVRRCLYTERGAFDAVASAKAYRQLLALADLPEQDRLETRLSLAERLLRDGKGTAAREQFELAAADPTVSEARRWDIRLQAANSRMVEGQFEAAAAAFRSLADAAGCPIELQGIALLSVGHALSLKPDHEAARIAFLHAADSEGLLPHHRVEATERAEEMRRLAAGMPACDPMATRIRVTAPPTPDIVLYVATDGNDTQPGTADKPLATLVGARDAIRQLRAKAGGQIPPGGVAVLVAGGRYRVDATLELTEEDSGTAESPIIYRAVEGQQPRFVGGVELGNLKPVTDPSVLTRLPEAARGKVRQIDLKAQGVADLGQIVPRGYGFAGYPGHPWVDLYLDGRPMQLARWPNQGFVKTGPVHRGQFHTDEAGQPGAFEYRDARPERWTQTDDVWLYGYWGHLWAGRSVRVARIEPKKRLLHIEHRSNYGYREDMPYYYFNVLEELDEPGEWRLDRKSGIAYAWPREDTEEPIVEFPLLAKPLVEMKGVSHVTLRGLCFELGRTEGLVMTGGKNNLLAGCTFRRFGTNALVVQGGSGHGILGCDLATLGAGGIRISGGDAKTLTPSGHFVENCHVRDFSRIDRVYAPAVLLEGVGGRIVHNLFHDSPHHAMRVEGFEHTIEWNEIHSVVYEADDQSGIDIYGNPTYRGIAIRNNFWHHIGSGHDVAGQSGIRLDDFISSVLITGNVFYRAAGGRFGAIQIHGGKDNITENNLLIDCKYALSFSPWGEKRWEEKLAGRMEYVAKTSGIDISSPPLSTRYPDLATMAENADRNFTWRNAAVDCGAFAIRDRSVNQWLDNVVFASDPGFVDVAKRDFRLPAESPLYRRFGFRPIPFEQIGLYEDPHRATWPVKHDVTPHFVDESPSAAPRE